MVNYRNRNNNIDQCFRVRYNILYKVNFGDLLLLEDNDLQNIFDIMDSFQIVFHPYYSKEGKFEHYDLFKKQKE